MRAVTAFFGSLLVASLLAVAPPGARSVAAADEEQIQIASYDVEQTPMSGFGCWTHTYTGTIVDTGRTVGGSVTCAPNADHLANYSGGSGTLNDGIVSTSTDDDQLLLTTMDADDGQPIEPVITLHLARPAHVTGISLYGGDVAWNAIPGALSSLTVDIGGYADEFATIPFGPPNVLEMPSDDLVDLHYTEQYWVPATTVVLRGFRADLFGSAFNQFSLTEITVQGDSLTRVAMDVKPDDKDPVTIQAGNHSKIPVAILGSAALPVTDIDWPVLTFGTHGYEGTLSWCGGPKDTNHDKVPDLVCQFAGYGISWSPGPATVYLNGRTKDGRAIFGTDTVFVTNGS